jgi:membrane-associated phospholipid phosphatase
MTRTHLLLAYCLTAAAASPSGMEPTAGAWHTWVIPDVVALRVPPPPVAAVSALEAQSLETVVSQLDDATRDTITYWNAGSPAYRWIQVAQDQVNSHGLGGPAATRAMSLVAAALNDAIIAAWDSKYAYARQRPSQIDSQLTPVIDVPDCPSYPSDYAAAATVASAVLDYLFPDQKSTIDPMAARAAQSRVSAGVEFPSDVVAGTTLGRAVADLVIARARTDGSSTAFTGSFPPTPGVWSSANPVAPLAGTWRPWALSSGSQVRLDPPPAFGSPDFQKQVDAVKQLARTNTTNHIAWFWQPSFIDPWVDLTTKYLFENNLSADTPRVAQLYAAVMVAQHDATIACWDTKYTYLELRPPQADPTITPVFALPQHPSFPSGHACASGAAAGVLGGAFPDLAPIFNAKAQEAGLSTFYAGIHYPNDVDQGLAQGAAVAKIVLTKAALGGNNGNQ